MPCSRFAIAILIGLIGWGGLSPAQSVYLSRFLPGDPLDDTQALHQIELFNPASQEQEVSGYWVMTRQVLLRIPNGTKIPALSRLTLSREVQPGPLSFAYRSLADFSIRVNRTQELGDYLALFDQEGTLVDAFYFAEQRSISFLPAEESFQLQNGNTLRLRLPAVGDSRWDYLQAVPDPAIAFVNINERWVPNSRRSNLFPATEYRFLQARYLQGIVTLKWETRFERDCYFHTVERSLDGQQFRPIASRKAMINISQPQEYLFYDTEVQPETRYQYRIRSTDKFGYQLVSPIAEALTAENPGGFSFDLIEEQADQGEYLNVRFSAKEAQRVRIKLLDEELRQLAVLYYGTIQANKQNLVSYTQPLPFGLYYVLVETEERRYHELVIVE